MPPPRNEQSQQQSERNTNNETFTNINMKAPNFLLLLLCTTATNSSPLSQNLRLPKSSVNPFNLLLRNTTLPLAHLDSSTSNTDTDTNSITTPDKDPAEECLIAVELEFPKLFDPIGMLATYGSEVMIGGEQLSSLLENRKKIKALLAAVIQGQPVNLRLMSESFLCSNPARSQKVDYLNQKCSGIKGAVTIKCARSEPNLLTGKVFDSNKMLDGVI